MIMDQPQASQCLGQRSVRPFRFLQLPPEIRIFIYEQLLCVSPYIITNHIVLRAIFPQSQVAQSRGAPFHDFIGSKQRREAKAASSSLAILRGNHQVYGEAMPIFYSNNTFRFPMVLDDKSLLGELFGLGQRSRYVASREINNHQRDLLSFIHLCEIGWDWVERNKGVYDYLATKKHLKKLTIEWILQSTTEQSNLDTLGRFLSALQEQAEVTLKIWDVKPGAGMEYSKWILRKGHTEWKVLERSSWAFTWDAKSQSSRLLRMAEIPLDAPWSHTQFTTPLVIRFVNLEKSQSSIATD